MRCCVSAALAAACYRSVGEEWWLNFSAVLNHNRGIGINSENDQKKHRPTSSSDGRVTVFQVVTCGVHCPDDADCVASANSRELKHSHTANHSDYAPDSSIRMAGHRPIRLIRFKNTECVGSLLPGDNRPQ